MWLSLRPRQGTRVLHPQGCLAEAASRPGPGSMTRLLATDRDLGNRGNARLTNRRLLSGAGYRADIEANSRCRFEGRSGFGLSDARRSAQGLETDMCPIRLATNDLGARGAGPAATVCTPVIAARRPIPVHSSGEPCWISGRSSHQFWRGMSSGSGTCSPCDIRRPNRWSAPRLSGDG